MLDELELHEAARTSEAGSQRRSVAVWRRAERARQLERRLALEKSRRREWAERIARLVVEEIGDLAAVTVSLYWPMRGEPDLRDVITEVTRRGGRCALPVVVERGRALEFHSWAPGEKLSRGFWNIPVPLAGTAVTPDVVIAPVVAYDCACYRLGYGGGYYDRTLGALTSDIRAFGVGYSMAKINTIYPQSHDIPMDAIVTEEGVLRARPQE
jgi:5,10-methenyltetrahydrofolate synthetase